MRPSDLWQKTHLASYMDWLGNHGQLSQLIVHASTLCASIALKGSPFDVALIPKRNDVMIVHCVSIYLHRSTLKCSPPHPTTNSDCIRMYKSQTIWTLTYSLSERLLLTFVSCIFDFYIVTLFPNRKLIACNYGVIFIVISTHYLFSKTFKVFSIHSMDSFFSPVVVLLFIQQFVLYATIARCMSTIEPLGRCD